MFELRRVQLASQATTKATKILTDMKDALKQRKKFEKEGCSLLGLLQI